MRSARLALATLATMLAIASSADAATVPASITADCSTNVQTQLSNWINAQPDGSTIEFPANGCYAQNDRIEVRDKRDLTIDGNGSTFRSSASNDGCQNRPNWLVLRGVNVTLQDVKIVGNFNPPPSVERSQGATYAYAQDTCSLAGNQFNMGVSIYGGRDIRVRDSDIRQVYGDGVLIAGASIIAGQEGQPLDDPTNVYLDRLTIARTARHNVAPVRGVNVQIRDSHLSDSWYWAIDAELDRATHKLSGLRVLRNRIRDYFTGGVAVPVAGDGSNTSDIEIAHNVFETGPDLYCNDVVLVGAYETVSNVLRDVRVDRNTFAQRSGVAVRFDHVIGGSIQGNRDAGYANRGCGYYDPALAAFTRLTNSSGVTIADNGPTAPGADATSTPPPPPPPPAPTCAAPTNLSASRLTNHGGYTNVSFAFDAVAGADEYHVYLQWSDNTGSPLFHYQTLSTNAGTLWSLRADKGYDIAVKAKCGDQLSPQSAIYQLPAG